MPVGSLRVLIERLRSAAGQPGTPSDAPLLARFVEGGDETAFEVLVWRHGAMVLALCQRLLGRSADADDAFQATFLTLVRKAGSIRNPGALAGWLYRVAYHISLDRRAQRARRRSRERPLPHEPAVAETVPENDLRELIDEEVNRLPEKFRRVVVLCYLQGRSTEEAALALGCPRGTVLSRLATARERLRGRLVRRGVAPALALAALATTVEAAPLPPVLVVEVLRSAAAFTAGNIKAIPPTVLALTQGALRAMFLLKVKVVAAVLFLVAAPVAGAGWLSYVATESGESPTVAAVQPTEIAPPAPPRPEPAKAEPPAKAAPPAQAEPQAEPPLPKVQIRGGAAGPDSIDQAIEWLRGNQLQQLIAIGSLAKAEVFPPRRAEVARELEKLLNGNDRLVALESTKALYVWATKDQVPSLLKALDDSSVFVRQGAIEVLGPLQDKRGVEPVAKFLPSFFERDVAGRSLIRMGPMVEEEVRKYVGHTDKGARDEAARVLRQLGKTGKDDDITAALGGLKDDNLFNRRKGLQWFAAADPEHPRRAEAAREIARLLKDGGVFDKQDAAKALAHWATREQVPVLIDALKEEHLPLGTKPLLARALGRLKDERAAPVLAELLVDPFDTKDAMTALVALGPLVEGEVLPYLEHERYYARAAACKVLRQIGTKKSLPALQEALAKANREMYGGYGDVAAAAGAAIKAIESKR